MISKTIHYCWFGRGKKSGLVEKCIASWKKCLPDYQIKEWNEDNFDVDSVQFTREAYWMRKWAFVADYVRLYALYHEGGIYLDSDVEILKPIDRFLSHVAFTGLEMPGWCSTGIMASEKRGAWIADIFKEYESRKFILPDGKLNMEPNVSYVTRLLKAHGAHVGVEHISLPDYVEVYPKEFFCPKVHESGKIVITPNTYAVHHFAGSWTGPREKTIKWLSQNVHPMIGYYAKYFWRNPVVVARDLLGFAKRHLG